MPLTDADGPGASWRFRPPYASSYEVESRVRLRPTRQVFWQTTESEAQCAHNVHTSFVRTLSPSRSSVTFAALGIPVHHGRLFK